MFSIREQVYPPPLSAESPLMLERAGEGTKNSLRLYEIRKSGSKRFGQGFKPLCDLRVLSGGKSASVPYGNKTLSPHPLRATNTIYNKKPSALGTPKL